MDKDKNIVNEFKKRTEKYFHSIGSITPQDIEDIIFSHAISTMDECGIDAEIINVVLSGSRCRGIENMDSDIDVVVEYRGDINEDVLFNILNESCLEIGGISVDINPINEHKTGNLETYLPCVEEYLMKKSLQKLDTDMTPKLMQHRKR